MKTKPTFILAFLAAFATAGVHAQVITFDTESAPFVPPNGGSWSNIDGSGINLTISTDLVGLNTFDNGAPFNIYMQYRDQTVTFTFSGIAPGQTLTKVEFVGMGSLTQFGPNMFTGAYFDEAIGGFTTNGAGISGVTLTDTTGPLDHFYANGYIQTTDLGTTFPAPIPFLDNAAVDIVNNTLTSSFSFRADNHISNFLGLTSELEDDPVNTNGTSFDGFRFTFSPIVPVPEPSSALLSALGIGGAAFVRRRRK